MPATINSDAVPKGVGYLHVPAKNAQGCLSVQTFYTPYLRTTAINERDLVKAAKMRVKDIESDSIAKHKDDGTFTCHVKHRMNSSTAKMLLFMVSSLMTNAMLERSFHLI